MRIRSSPSTLRKGGCLAGLLLACACSSPPETFHVLDREGRARVTLTRIDGRKEGPVLIRHRDGRTTRGTYVNDRREGLWTTTDVKGDTVEVLHFRNGAKHGIQAYWSPEGRLRRVERFTDGLADGPLYHFFPDGLPEEEAHYRNGVLEGWHMQWFPLDSVSKQLIMGEYKAGERNGPWAFYFGNGRLNAEGPYLHGRRTGLWRRWDAQGREKPHEIYRNDSLLRKVPLD